MAGDEEEDGIDDLENEFSFAGRNDQDMQYMAEAMLQGHMSYGRGGDVDMPQVVHTMPQVPLLTNGQMVMLYHFPPSSMLETSRWDSFEWVSFFAG